jgi:ubiquinone/menaquinone biosynthesis C-methylase UbiE
MEPAFQRRIQRYGWDKASPYYEAFWHEQLKPAQDLLLEMAGLREGESVLDIACGTGLVSFRALGDIGNGTLVGTDISDKMVELASSLAAQKGETRARFQRMDAEELTMQNGSFDVALCSLGLMYMPAPLKALEEMYRVLKPGGRAITAVWGQRQRCGWAEIFEIVDRHVASEVCPMFFNLGNPGMLELNLKAAGFSAITTRRIQTTLFYKDAKEALGAAFDGGPVALAYNKFNDSIKQEVHSDYLTCLAPFKKGDGYEVPGEFVVARGFNQSMGSQI